MSGRGRDVHMKVRESHPKVRERSGGPPGDPERVQEAHPESWVGSGVPPKGPGGPHEGP